MFSDQSENTRNAQKIDLHQLHQGETALDPEAGTEVRIISKI